MNPTLVWIGMFLFRTPTATGLAMPREESHQADNLCQKNMVVWRQPSSGQNCSEDAAASALSLINNATGNWNQSEAITDYIVTGLS